MRHIDLLVLALVGCGARRPVTAPATATTGESAAPVVAPVEFACAAADPEPIEPFWLVLPARSGPVPGVWVNGEGKTYSFLLSGEERPAPLPEQAPSGSVDSTGATWTQDGKRRICLGDGALLWDAQPARADGMRCWITQPCGLRCACDGHTPLLHFDVGAESSAASLSPPPQTPAQCRAAFALLADALMSQDAGNHWGEVDER